MKKLCIIFGGASSEHDISIITGMQLYNAIKQKYSVRVIYLGKDNKFYLPKATKASDFANIKNLQQVAIVGTCVYKIGIFTKRVFEIDCVINCCHGGVGEDGNLAGFFEVNGIKHTSSACLCAQLSMNKTLAKQLVKDVVPVVEGVLITKQNKQEKIKYITKNFKQQFIIKPNSLGSSIGVKLCTKQNFTEQIDAIFEMNDDVLAEPQVENLIEYNQACFCNNGALIFSAIEQPLTKNSLLTFEDKYEHSKKGKDRAIPAEISQELAQQITTHTKNIYKTLKLNGVVRVDYLYNSQTKELFFNEVNTIPGSMAFYLFEPVGIDYISLVEMLIKNATEPKKYVYFKTDILSKTKT